MNCYDLHNPSGVRSGEAFRSTLTFMRSNNA